MRQSKPPPFHSRAGSTTPGLGLLVSRVYSEGTSDSGHMVPGLRSFARKLGGREGGEEGLMGAGETGLTGEERKEWGEVSNPSSAMIFQS